RVADLLLVDLLVGGGLAVEQPHPIRAGFRHEVPLVDDDDDRAARLVSVTADVGVRRGDSLTRVDDEQRHVSGFEVLAAHDDAELFGEKLGLALAADAGGVDETEAVAVALYDFVDR